MLPITHKMTSTIPSVICVPYTDKFSNNNDSHVDIRIGNEHNIVASNQAILKCAEPGTVVIIVATKVNKNRRQLQFGVLCRKIEGECRMWENASPNGRAFKYHWTFKPLTDILYMYEVSGLIDDIAKRMQIDIKYMFNSRFCGYGIKYIPLIQEVIATRAIPILT